MIPYANFFYFGLLLYPVVPTVLLGLLGRRTRVWMLLATLAVLLVQYDDPLQLAPSLAVPTIGIVAVFTLLQFGIARGFLALRRRGVQHWSFYGALALGLAPLVVAKFLPLAAPNYLFGFLGISYVSFRALDVTFSIQDHVITELPAAQYFAYLLFFPAISSGPIDRYHRFAADWQRQRSRPEFLSDLDSCAQHLFRGLLYKFIIAYLIKLYWLDPVTNAPGWLHIISYMYAYTGYLFFDFAGYSAFAVGVSYLFGIHTPENFRLPFLAHNIREFWNRWHISLSAWLRDHVYMRFVLAATKGRWFNNRYLASYSGFLLSMGLMGLWHGPQACYLLYGLYHATLMIGHDIFARWNKTHKLWGEGRVWNAVGVFVTFHLVCFGFLIFSGQL